MLDSLTVDQCNRCERSQKECVRRRNQVRGSRCKQCVKSHQMCQYLSKSPSKTKASSSSSNSNFDLELMRQQLKASQEDFRIAQQQLQLANSRIEAQRELYEAQLAGYRRRVVWPSEPGLSAESWASIFFFACTLKWNRFFFSLISYCIELVITARVYRRRVLKFPHSPEAHTATTGISCPSGTQLRFF